MRIALENVADALRVPGIVGGWLFGSAAEGNVRAGSDVDIGVLFEAKPDLDALSACRMRLQRALEFDGIDLIPLNDASPLLRFEALCGKRVYCADEDRCAGFASLTAREYEDGMAMIRRWTAA